MYFRLTKTKSSPVLQLVQSYRDHENRPRQKILLSLGDADLPKEIWKEVAEEVENHFKGTITLIKPTDSTDGEQLFLQVAQEEKNIELSVIATPMGKKIKDVSLKTGSPSSIPSTIYVTSQNEIIRYLTRSKLHHTELHDKYIDQKNYSLLFRHAGIPIFSSDRRFMALIDQNSVIINPKREKRQILTHEEIVKEAVFSPNMTFMISKDEKNTAYLWNIENNKLLMTFPEVSSALHNHMFLNEGKEVALGYKDNSIVLWDLEKQKKLHTFIEHKTPPHYLFYAKEAKILFSIDKKSPKVYRFEIASEEQTRGDILAPSAPVTTGIFLENSPYFVSGTTAGEMHIWDKRNGNAIKPFPKSEGEICSLYSLSQGKELLSLSKEGLLSLWNVEKRFSLGSIPLQGESHLLLMDLEQSFCLVAKKDLSLFSVKWKKNKNQAFFKQDFLGKLKVKEELQAATMLTKETFAIATAKELMIFRFNKNENKANFLRNFAIEGCERLWTSKDRNYFLLSHRKEIKIVDVHTGRNIHRFSTQEGSITALDMDKNFLVAGDDYGLLYVWEIKSKRLIACSQVHQEEICSLHIDEEKILSTGKDHVVRCSFLKKEKSDTLYILWQTPCPLKALKAKIEKIKTEESNTILLKEKGARTMTEQGLIAFIKSAPLEKLSDPIDTEGSTWIHLAARWGYIKALQALKEKGFIFNQLNKKRQNALHVIALDREAGNMKAVVPFLIKMGLKQNTEDLYSRTPLYIAAQEGHTKCLEILLANGGEEFVNQPVDGCTPVCIATQEGRAKCLKILLTHGGTKTVNQANKYGVTPVLMASYRGDTKCLEVLLANGGKKAVNQPGNNGYTPVLMAAQQGHAKCLEILLAHGGIKAVNQPNKNGLTPVLIAAGMSHTKCLKLLLENGGKETVNQPNEEGFTPVFIAAQEGNTECLELLLKNGGKESINQPAKDGTTPVLMAAQNGHTECLKLLLVNGGKETVNQPDQDGYTPVYGAAQNGYTECLELLLKNGGKESINQPAKDGTTPVLMAAQRGRVKCLEILLANGGKESVNKPDNDGATSILIAVQEGRTECLKLLLANGGKKSINQPRKDGITPVWMAAQQGNTECLKLLLANGGKKSINQPRKNGSTPVFIAAQEGNTECLKLLLLNGGKESINQPGKDGATPVLIAAQNGHTECLKLLLLNGGKESINQPGKDGTTPVLIAAQQGNTECLKLLLANGGKKSINQPGKNGSTPVFIAAQEGNTECLKLLLENGGKETVNQPNEKGTTPVWMAAQQGNTECLKLLLENGGEKSMNQPDQDGVTPVYIAAQKGNTECLKLLLENGGKETVNQPNKGGYTPVSAAAYGGHEKCLELLLKNGAEINQKLAEIAAKRGNKKCTELIIQFAKEQEKKINIESINKFLQVYDTYSKLQQAYFRRDPQTSLIQATNLLNLLMNPKQNNNNDNNDEKDEKKEPE